MKKKPKEKHVLLKLFRPIIVWWIKFSGIFFRSTFFYYLTTVQRRIFDRHKLTTNAAAISFFFLLSLIPMLFILIAILASFVNSPEQAEKYLLSFIENRVPEGGRQFILELTIKSNLIQNVKDILSNRGWIALVSVASLLWTSSGAFSAIEDAMNTIFGVQSRNYFVSRLVEMSMVIITGSLFLMSNTVTAIIEALQQYHVEIFGLDFSNLPYLWDLLTTVMPYVLTIAMFYIIYKILPKTPIYKRAALLGATVAGVLLELSIYLFAYYVKNFSSYNAFYGSVAGIVISIFTIYLSSIILLIGAEITEIANSKVDSVKELAITIKEFE